MCPSETSAPDTLCENVQCLPRAAPDTSSSRGRGIWCSSETSAPDTLCENVQCLPPSSATHCQGGPCAFRDFQIVKAGLVPAATFAHNNYNLGNTTSTVQVSVNPPRSKSTLIRGRPSWSLRPLLLIAPVSTVKVEHSTRLKSHQAGGGHSATFGLDLCYLEVLILASC